MTAKELKKSLLTYVLSEEGWKNPETIARFSEETNKMVGPDGDDIALEEAEIVTSVDGAVVSDLESFLEGFTEAIITDLADFLSQKVEEDRELCPICARRVVMKGKELCIQCYSLI